MKKRLLCLFLAVLCALPLMLTGCGGDDDYTPETGTSKKPMTITLYGITGDTTTEEAIKAVEAEINEYTEGNFNTHILLRLYPEDEYYEVIENTFTNLKYGTKDEEDVPVTDVVTDEAVTTDGAVTEAPADDDDEPEYSYGNYPAEDGTQLDIFMVQGAAKMYAYYEEGYLANLSGSLADSSRLLNDYISARLLAITTIGGERNADGSVKNGALYGVPNNSIAGDYTYLLVHKELSAQYYYAEQDVNTLDGLANFLSDAVEHEEYITLYNEPTLNMHSFADTLLGAVITDDMTAFTRVSPYRLLNDDTYVNYIKNLYAFRRAGYITEGDAYSLPVDENGEEKKVAAAFIKGDATLPAQYEDEYYVITYQKPLATAEELPGTMFCVSSYAENVDRCMEIITALQTKADFRNLFQYGVEGTHYRRDEYTGMITVTSDDYVMDPADTGNLFLLDVHDGMSEEMLKFAENNWALAKLQYRETVHTPYIAFDFKIVNNDNFKQTSLWYKETYASEYNTALLEALNKAKAEAKEKGEKFNEADFDELAFKTQFDAEFTQDFYPYANIENALNEVKALGDDLLMRIDTYDPAVDGEWEAFLDALNQELLDSVYYQHLMDLSHPDGLLTQYTTWCKTNNVIG